MIYRPSTGIWWILTSSSQFTEYMTIGWGNANMTPVAEDYDGDGRTDPAVVEGLSQQLYARWWVLKSSDDYRSYVTNTTRSGGAAAPGDYDGDGRADFAVYLAPSGFFIYPAASNFGSEYRVEGVGDGTANSIPVPADYDGDGITDVAAFTPSGGYWDINLSSGGRVHARWGMKCDAPIVGYSDGLLSLALWRPSTGIWWIQHGVAGNSPYETVGWGDPDFTPVPGDYDGDGITDLAVWHRSTGTWWIRTSSSAYQSYFTRGWGGERGDVPIGAVTNIPFGWTPNGPSFTCTEHPF